MCLATRACAGSICVLLDRLVLAVRVEWREINANARVMRILTVGAFDLDVLGVWIVLLDPFSEGARVATIQIKSSSIAEWRERIGEIWIRDHI